FLATYELNDDPVYLEFFLNGGTIKEFLSENIWGIDLNSFDGLYEKIQENISLLEKEERLELL
ncbi:MAG: hypothetical protein PHG90_06625, partial [Clostridia bacterium]|nr:hypothetical protein [Clostridia bacterium]